MSLLLDGNFWYWVGTFSAIGIVGTLVFLCTVWPGTKDDKKERKPIEIPDVDLFDTRVVRDSAGQEWRRTVPNLPEWTKKG